MMLSPVLRTFACVCAWLFAFAYTQSALAGPLAYVSHENDTVSVIDTATQRHVDTIKIDPGGRYVHISVSPDGKRLWAVKDGRFMGKVSIVDTGTRKVVWDFPAGEYLGAVAFVPNGNAIYVADWWSSAVLVFDVHGNPDGKITIGQGIRGPCAIAAALDRAFVANCHTDTISIIDTRAHNVIRNVAVGQWTTGLSVAPDGKHVYVLVGIPNDLAVVNMTDYSVSRINVVHDGSSDIALSADGRYAYVTNGKKSVLVVDLTAKVTVATIDVGMEPSGIAITPDGKHAYIANTRSGDVSVIDLSTRKVVQTISVGGRPGRIVIAK